MPRTSTSQFVSRREFLTTTGGLLAAAPGLARGTPTTLVQASPKFSPTLLPEPQRQKRPAWWRDEGVVIAGDDWEPLLPRLRSGSFDRSQGFMTYDQRMAMWRQEHSEKMARRLKELGFNFIMIPLYKGGGLKTERPSMEDAKRFTEICHGLGLHVGCYMFSGTIFYESMLAENPTAQDWFILDYNGKYSTYYGDLYFRRWVNRDHPGVRAHLRELTRFAIQEAKVDLIHFDNYIFGPGYEPHSVRRFREYLKKKYTPEERTRRFGFPEMDFIEPPPAPPEPDLYNTDPLFQDFVDFRCEVLADTYRELAEYARSLNPDIMVECNPAGYVGELYSSLGIGTVDHTLLLQWGGAFWDEGYPSQLENGIVKSRFRSHMMGRQFNNMVFHYTSDRVAMAESMANNLQCIGCPAWVVGDEIIPPPFLSMHNPKQFDPNVLASIRFFRREQQYYRDTEQVADVGVLNTYANTAYGPTATRNAWGAFTQALYQGKAPFALVPGRYPGNLSRFRVLVLADLALISDELVNAVRSFVRDGGGLVMTGVATQFDEHSYRRERAALAGLFAESLGDKPLTSTPGKGRAVYIPRVVIPEKFQIGMLPENRRELLEAVRWAAGGPLQVEVKAPETVTMSLYLQPSGRRLLHLVNYDEDHPVRDVEVALQLPLGKRVTSVTLLSPDETLLSPDLRPPQSIAAEQKGRELCFNVPGLEIYDLVVVE